MALESRILSQYGSRRPYLERAFCYRVCILYFSDLGGANFSRVHVHVSIFSLPVEDVDDKGQRANNKQGVERGVDCLSQSEEHLNQSNQKSDKNLPFSGGDDGTWICYHEENEELIHGPCQRRNFRQEDSLSHQAPDPGKKEKRDYIHSTDMKFPDLDDSKHSYQPDGQHRPHIAPPLNAQNGHAVGGDHEHYHHPEIGRVPDMTTTKSEHIL